MIESMPPGWAETTIGELGRYINGRGFAEAEWRKAGVPIIRIQNLNNPAAPFNYSDQQHESKYLVQDGDLLVAWAASLGVYRWNRGLGWLNQHIFRVEVEPRLVTKDYLYYALKFALDDLYARAHGSGMIHITRGEFESHPVYLPPVEEQKRIVSKLNELFSSIEEGERALERVRKLMERYRQSVLKAAVTGELTREWRSQHAGQLESGETLLTRILECRGLRAKTHDAVVTDRVGALPVGWAKSRIDTAGQVQLGRQRSPKHHSGKHMRPYLRVANVFEERIDTSDVKEMNFTPQEFRAFELRPGDILLNEGQSRELVGRPAIYRGELPGACFTNTLVRFRAERGVIPEYALLVFLYYFKARFFESIARITTNIAHLGAGRFAEMSFPLPSTEEQREILDRVALHSSLYDHALRDVDERRRQMKSLRRSVLKTAFSGQLVPQGLNDEPASVLIKRIAAERTACTPSAPEQTRRKKAQA